MTSSVGYDDLEINRTESVMVTPADVPIPKKRSSLWAPMSPLTSATPFSNSSNGSYHDLGGSVRETSRKRQGEDDDGNKTINQFSIVGDLGKGAYSKVKLVIDNETDEVRAMKVMRKSILKKAKVSDGCAMDNVRRELALLKKMNHKNIVRLYEVIDDAEDEKMYMVFEYLEKGNLLKIEDDGTTGGVVMSVPDTKRAMMDIINGLSFLHQHLIFHRDIKPDNLLLDRDGTVKLSDFGVSISFETEADATHMRFFEGTPVFLAPEVVEGRAEVDAGAVDIWAMGITFYAMIFGRLPFHAETIQEVTARIINDRLPIPDSNPDTSAVSLLHGLLEKDPAKRLTIGEIKEHEFFQQEAETFNVADTITVSAEEIANAVTSRQWTNLSYMFLKVRSKLKTFKEKARNNIELKSPLKDPGDGFSTCTSIKVPMEDSTTYNAVEMSDPMPMPQAAGDESPSLRKRGLETDSGSSTPTPPQKIAKESSSASLLSAGALSDACDMCEASDTAYSSDTAQRSSDTAYPARQYAALITPRRRYMPLY